MLSLQPYNVHECKVDKVRLQTHDKTITNYQNNVKIHIKFHSSRELEYLRIKSDGKYVMTTELSTLKWIDESSADGVSTISSSTHIIVIMYNPKNKSTIDFFNELKSTLKSKGRRSSFDSATSQPNQVELESMLDKLVNAISSGDPDTAEKMAKKLAKTQVNVQFNLTRKIDNESKNLTKSKQTNDATESPNPVLKLSVRIEYFSKEDPIEIPLDIQSGTTLRSLKEQIENQTNIQCSNQYWFAFNRYLIPDEYIFGTLIPFISNKNQQNSIRSGDTLILYIVQ